MKKLRRLIKLAWLGGARPRVKLYVMAIARLRDSQRIVLARMVEARLQRKYGVFLSHKAEFDSTLDLEHPVGIVIGQGVKLGKRVRIFQNVTLGGARIGDWQDGNYPQVGDDTVIFAGAVIVGKVRIGTNCVIGANSVVTKDIPDYATAAGSPARILKQAGPPPSPAFTD